METNNGTATSTEKNLDSACASVTGEIARTDSKASLLLTFTGADLAGLASAAYTRRAQRVKRKRAVRVAHVFARCCSACETRSRRTSFERSVRIHSFGRQSCGTSFWLCRRDHDGPTTGWGRTAEDGSCAAPVAWGGMPWRLHPDWA